jgi:SOS-response transcriptional repressor LexA
MSKAIASLRHPSERALSPRQLAILKTIYTHSRELGYSPTLRDIGTAVGISSSSVVTYYINGLVRLGYITRPEKTPRAIVLLDPAYRALRQAGEVAAPTSMHDLIHENHSLRTRCQQLEAERTALLRRLHQAG